MRMTLPTTQSDIHDDSLRPVSKPRLPVTAGLILSALMLISIQCSIYFNTFYNAETAFDAGLTLHEKALRDRPDSLVVEPPADARAKYDRAIEKAVKVLDVYPKDKKWHDDALFLLGKSYYYEKEFGKSVRRLRQLQEEYPESKYVPESYVYIARDYIGQDELAKAEEALRFALDRYPALDNDQNVSLLLVEIAIRREGKAQAIDLLEKARAGVRSPEKKLELLLRVSELYMDLNQYGKAATLLKSAPRNKKDALREYRIDRNLVMCQIRLDSLASALTLIKGMLANKLYVPYTKDILFVKGSVFAHQGRVDEAIVVFKQIVGDLGDTTALKSDTSRVASRALYELGLLYQKKKGSYKEAEKYFQLIADRAVKDTSVAPLAAKRLKAMKDLTDLRARLAARDTAVRRMQTRFTIGELFYYELDEPDSALVQFIGIAGDSARDSVYTPKSLCAAASLARGEFRDTLFSDSLYRKLIADFPGSDYIGQAQKEMRSAGAIKTRRELAEESFYAAETAWIRENDIKGAVQKFYNTYKEYSDLEIAPKSLFVAAWLADNELQKKKTAKSLYEKICDRFPASLYCIKLSQPRLKTVIDTLEALRRLQREGQSDTTRKKAAISSVKTNNAASVSASDTSSKGAADSLDVSASLGIDSTAAPAITPAKPRDTGDAFMRRPGDHGRMQGRGMPVADSLQKK
jgi:tetratricopeptide (TPR) repeat protein